MTLALEDKDVAAFGDAMEEVLTAFPDTPQYKKAKSAFLDGLWDDFQCDVIDRMGEVVEGHIRDMAARIVTSILNGNEYQMRRYLGVDGYTGRGGDHSVIHGTLFETGPIELRKNIAQAHADLIQNERISDLEDQVRSLVEQVNKKDGEISALRERINNCAERW